MKIKLEILKTDITKVDVYAIVNAANYSLLGGGRVDGTRGKEILEGCRKILKGVTKII